MQTDEQSSTSASLSPHLNHVTARPSLRLFGRADRQHRLGRKLWNAAAPGRSSSLARALWSRYRRLQDTHTRALSCHSPTTHSTRAIVLCCTHARNSAIASRLSLSAISPAALRSAFGLAGFWLQPTSPRVDTATQRGRPSPPTAPATAPRTLDATTHTRSLPSNERAAANASDLNLHARLEPLANAVPRRRRALQRQTTPPTRRARPLNTAGNVFSTEPQPLLQAPRGIREASPFAHAADSPRRALVALRLQAARPGAQLQLPGHHKQCPWLWSAVAVAVAATSAACRWTSSSRKSKGTERLSQRTWSQALQHRHSRRGSPCLEPGLRRACRCIF